MNMFGIHHMLGKRMLTERQMSIIISLINADSWVTSEKLSISLSLNKKTIQVDIKEIITLLQDELVIEVNKHKGYCIEHLSETGRNILQEEINRLEGKNCLPPRQSTFILYLLFLKSYITMQNLAEAFYISKTAVSLEINVIKRWINRYDGLLLEISNKNGIMIHATEEKKRIYCSKHGTQRAFKHLPFPNEVKKEHSEYVSILYQILSKNCIQYHVVLTGEELQKAVQFLACSILRSKVGYCRSSNYEVLSITDFVQNLKTDIFKETDYLLEDAELNDLQLIINESNLLTKNNHQNKPLEIIISEFMLKMSEITHINYHESEVNIHDMSDYIEKMKLRYHSGNIAINHYNEEIILQYPLEAYLCYRYVEKYFSLKVSKETSFIALFLSTYFIKYRNMHSVLFVCDQNITIITSIQNILKSLVPTSTVKEFKVIPTYEYNINPDIRFSYDVLLTTNQKVVFTDYTFFLIPSIITNEDIVFLQQYVMKQLEKINSIKKKNMMDMYMKELMIKNTQQCDCIDEIINQKQDGSVSYHTFSESKIYIARISNDDKTSITIFQLESPVLFMYKKIKTIIYATFNEDDENIFAYFETVSEVLKQYK